MKREDKLVIESILKSVGLESLKPQAVRRLPNLRPSPKKTSLIGPSGEK